MEVRSVSGRGRGLFAPRDLQGGQIVLCESPLLVYAEAEAAATGSFCAHCARRISSFVECASCFRARFCDARCRGAAEASLQHGPWGCSALRDLAGLGLDREAETQARFLIAAVALAARNPDGFQKLLLLDGQASAVAHDPRSDAVAAFVQGLWKKNPLQLPGFTMEMLMALLAKDKINAFGLMAPASGDGQRKVRAYAIYAQASMLNHDCLPNACRFDYLEKEGESNRDIYIRLLHDVSQGSEICISYFPVNWNYRERQKRLLEDYGFECKCERCSVERNWSDAEDEAMEDDDEDHDQDDQQEDAMERDDNDFPHAMFFVKYLCPEEGCGGTMAPMPDNVTAMECNVCGRTRSEQEFAEELQQHGMEQ